MGRHRFVLGMYATVCTCSKTASVTLPVISPTRARARDTSTVIYSQLAPSL